MIDVRKEALEEAARHVESRARNEELLAISSQEKGRTDDALAHGHRATALANVADQIRALADRHDTKPTMSSK